MKSARPILWLLIVGLMAVAFGPGAGAAPKPLPTPTALTAFERDPDGFAKKAVADALADAIGRRRTGIVQLAEAGELAVPHLVAVLARKPLSAKLEERVMLAMRRLGPSAVAPLVELLAANGDPHLAGIVCNHLARTGGRTAIAVIKMTHETTKDPGLKAVTATALKRITQKEVGDLPDASTTLLKIATHYYERGVLLQRPALPKSARIWTAQGDRLTARAIPVPEAYDFYRAGRFAALALRQTPTDAVAMQTRVCALAAEYAVVDRLVRHASLASKKKPAGSKRNAKRLTQEHQRLTQAFAIARSVGSKTLLGAIRIAIEQKTYRVAGNLLVHLEAVTELGDLAPETRKTLAPLLVAPDKIARSRAAVFLVRRGVLLDPAMQAILAEAALESASGTALIVHPNKSSRRRIASIVPPSVTHFLYAGSALDALETLRKKPAIDLLFLSMQIGVKSIDQVVKGLADEAILSRAKIVVVMPTEKEVGSEKATRLRIRRRVIGVISEASARATVTRLCAESLRSGDRLYQDQLDPIALQAIELLVAQTPAESLAQTATQLRLIERVAASPEIIAAAIRGLGLLGGRSDSDRFVALLASEGEPLVSRLAAAAASAQIIKRSGPVGASQYVLLKGALQSPEAAVRSAAASVLAGSALSPAQKAELLGRP